MDYGYGLGHFGGGQWSVANGVRPILTLKSGVVVVGGAGTKADPYIISNGNVAAIDNTEEISWTEVVTPTNDLTIGYGNNVQEEGTYYFHTKDIAGNTNKTKIDIYEVRYEAEEGVNNVPDTQYKAEGVDLKLSGKKPTKTGYKFDEWRSTGINVEEKTYQASSTYDQDVNVTFVVNNWVPEPIDVTINHRLQNADDNEYTVYRAENRVINYGTEITLINYILAEGDLKYATSNLIKVDGNEYIDPTVVVPENPLTIDIYYDRLTYELTLVSGDYIEIVNAEGTVTFDSTAFRWGETIEISAELQESEEGYANLWLAWTSSNIGLIGQISQQSATLTMPKGSVTLTANGTRDANVITVEFDSEEGTLIGSSSKLVVFNAKYGDLPIVTKTGYTFNGWYTESVDGEKIDGNTIVTNTENHTLYAQFTANPIKVNFDSQGGTYVESVSKIYNDEYGELVEPTKTGWTFEGWYLNGTKVEPTTKVTLTVEHTLIAKWTKVVTITYDKNTADTVTNMPDPNPQTTDLETEEDLIIISPETMITTKLSSEVPERVGYDFVGWATSGNAVNANYDAETEITINKNTILYAIWKGAEYQVTFDAVTNGGTCNTESQTVAYESKYGQLPTATKVGYTFNGWYTESVGGTKVEPNTIVREKQDHTLYAQFTASNVMYTIEHYLENANGEGYTLYKSEQKQGLADSITGLLADFAIAELDLAYTKYKNATVNGEEVTTATIAADGSLVIKLHYTRNSYKLTLKLSNGSILAQVSHKWGKNVTISASLLPGLDGNKYAWGYWESSDVSLMSNKKEQSTTIVMPKGDVILTAIEAEELMAMLLPGQEWLGSIERSSVTKITFTNTYISKGTETIWDANTSDTAKIMGYLDGTEVYMVFEANKVYANPDSSFMFESMNNLVSIEGLYLLDTSNVTNMSCMFSLCEIETLDLSSFDTSNVTDMSCMFSEAHTIRELDLSSFDTVNVTDMSYMFDCCDNLSSVDISSFDTSNVTNMTGMFEYCYNITNLDLSSFDTSNVTNMEQMFEGMDSMSQLELGPKFIFVGTDHGLSPEIWYDEDGNGYTVEEMSNRPVKTYHSVNPVVRNVLKPANGYLGSYYGTELTKITFTNDYAPTGNEDATWNAAESGEITGYLNGSEVTIVSPGKIYANANSSNMFNCMYMLESLKGLELIDTSNVTDMSYMFSEGLLPSDADFSTWDTSNVTNMSAMFYYCSPNNLDLSSFDTSSVTNMSMMFSECYTDGITLGPDFSFVGTDHGFGEALGTEIWYDTKGNSYTINEMSNRPETTYYSYLRIECECTGCSNEGDYEGYCETCFYNRESLYCENCGSCYECVNVCEICRLCNECDSSEGEHACSEDYTLLLAPGSSWISNEVPTWEVHGISFTNNYETTGDEIHWYANAEGAGRINAYYYDENIYVVVPTGYKIYANPDSSGMFAGTNYAWISGLNLLDTSKVTNMSNMFAGNESYSGGSLDLSSFDTSSVTSMSGMFNGALYGSINLSNFDTSKVTNMSYMFDSCGELEQLTLGPNFAFVGTDHKLGYSSGELEVSTWYDAYGNSYTTSTMSNRPVTTYYSTKQVSDNCKCDGCNNPVYEYFAWTGYCESCYNRYDAGMNSVCSNCGSCADCVTICGTDNEGSYHCVNCCPGHEASETCICNGCENEEDDGTGWCESCRMGTICNNCKNCSAHAGTVCLECGLCGNCKDNTCQYCGTLTGQKCLCNFCQETTRNESGYCDNCENATHCQGCGNCSSHIFVCNSCKKCDGCTEPRCGECGDAGNEYCYACCPGHIEETECACNGCENTDIEDGYCGKCYDMEICETCGYCTSCPNDTCSTCGGTSGGIECLCDWCDTKTINESGYCDECLEKCPTCESCSCTYFSCGHCTCNNCANCGACYGCNPPCLACDGCASCCEGHQYITASFDANGGSGTMDPILVVLTDDTQYVTLPECTFTRAGYTFLGWTSDEYRKDEGYVDAIPGDSILIYWDTTFYAVWE